MQPIESTSTTGTVTRLSRLQQIARDAGVDTVALVPGANLIYLTGASFHLMERPLIAFIPAAGEPTVIIPTLELSKITDLAPFPMRFFSYGDTDGYLGAFEQACKALDLSNKKIAVEGLRMRVLEGQLIQRFSPGCTLVSADDALGVLRLYKDKTELDTMRKAISISEKALEAIIDEIRPGMTEIQITNMLLNAMAQAGSGGNSFDPIVLAGSNTALPHGIPGDRPLQDGDLLLFDYGTNYQGYASDITRVFAVGKIDDELKKIYETVLAANEAAIRAVKPGVEAQEIDRAARKVITDAGYGPYFVHRTGHGLGMDIHEGPYIREGNAQVLEPGMVFTIEPGIYVPGKGGVRIEDDVVVTETGCDVLTSFPKKLRTIGR